MRSDPIIEEVWRNRDAYVAEHDYDLHKIVLDLQERQEKSIGRIVDLRKKTIDAVRERPDPL
jgi:hypothetical protein